MGHLCRRYSGHSCRVLSCRTLLWDTLLEHSCGKPWWDILVRHFCGTLTLVERCCGALLLDTLVGKTGRTLLVGGALVGHSSENSCGTLNSCGALSCDTLVGQTLLWDRHSCGALLRNNLVGHSCGTLTSDTPRLRHHVSLPPRPQTHTNAFPPNPRQSAWDARLPPCRTSPYWGVLDINNLQYIRSLMC